MALLSGDADAAGGATAPAGPNVLVVNAGSSSLKLRLLDPADRVVWTADLPSADDVAVARAALVEADERHGGIGAVGHRFVHGGPDFTAPAILTGKVVAALEKLTPLAPLHQPVALAGVATVRAALPAAVQVACFDTAFHATIPAAASTYAVPAEWRQRYGARRYGFHGLSHAYASRRAAELVGAEFVGAELAGLADPAESADPAGLRVVTAHLGAGASLAAVRGGVSVDTTMGFTPLEGLVMATRSGTVDPGLVLWLIREAGLSADEVGVALERRSGLLALAGTADMRAVVDAAERGEDRAAAALAVYLHRLRGLAASMAAALDGLDVLVFTGGVGERSAAVRAGAAAGLGFLGVGLDPDANRAAGSADDGSTDLEISPAGAAVRVFVVAAREDLEIVRGVRAAVAGAGPADLRGGDPS